MIKAVFKVSEGEYTGFCISGHSGYAQSGSDIVCAAVSSAVDFCLTLVCDVKKIPNALSVCEQNAQIVFDLEIDASKEQRDEFSAIVEALYTHLCGIAADYSKNVSCIITEV